MRLYKYVKVFANMTQHEVSEAFDDKRIKVNGEIQNFTYIVKDEDIISLDDKVISTIPFKYFLYYKPRGVLSDLKDSMDAYHKHIGFDYKLMPVGRLDKDSEGLMILSNDGAFIHKMNSDDIEKEYIVKLKDVVTDKLLEEASKSFIIKGKSTKEMKIEKIDDYTIKMILFDGRYHQIRRAIIFAGNTVINLKRVRVGEYLLDNMKVNEIREIKKGL